MFSGSLAARTSLVAGALGTVLLLGPPVGAGTITVEPDGSGDQPTIAAALAAAEDGDVIALGNGTFVADGNRELWIYDLSVTLRSQSGDASACIIDPNGMAASTRRALQFQGTPEGFRVEQITFRGGAADAAGTGGYGGAIWLEAGAAPVFEGCIFRENLARRGGAVYAAEECTPEFIDCRFVDNEAQNYGGAVYCAADGAHALFISCLFAGNAAGDHGGAVACWNNCTPTLEACTLVGNSAPVGSGLHMRFGASPALTRTIIAYGLSGAAIGCESGCHPTFECCNLYRNAGGDWVGSASGLEGTAGNISLRPRFCDVALGNYQLCPGSPCLAGTDPNPECLGIGAYGIGCSDCLFVCCVDGACHFVTPEACADLSGDLITDPAYPDCVTNPCPVPAESMSWGQLKTRFREATGN